LKRRGGADIDDAAAFLHVRQTAVCNKGRGFAVQINGVLDFFVGKVRRFLKQSRARVVDEKNDVRAFFFEHGAQMRGEVFFRKVGANRFQLFAVLRSQLFQARRVSAERPYFVEPFFVEFL
jgi:hypothetical protein